MSLPSIAALCCAWLCFVSAFALSRSKLGFIHDFKRNHYIVTIIFVIVSLLAMIMSANQCKKACEEKKGKHLNLMESAALFRSYDKETTEDIEYISKNLNDMKIKFYLKYLKNN